jgi:hypothetical protein
MAINSRSELLQDFKQHLLPPQYPLRLLLYIMALGLELERGTLEPKEMELDKVIAIKPVLHLVNLFMPLMFVLSKQDPGMYLDT